MRSGPCRRVSVHGRSHWGHFHGAGRPPVSRGEVLTARQPERSGTGGRNIDLHPPLRGDRGGAGPKPAPTHREDPVGEPADHEEGQRHPPRIPPKAPPPKAGSIRLTRTTPRGSRSRRPRHAGPAPYTHAQNFLSPQTEQKPTPKTEQAKAAEPHSYPRRSPRSSHHGRNARPETHS